MFHGDPAGRTPGRLNRSPNTISLNGPGESGSGSRKYCKLTGRLAKRWQSGGTEGWRRSLRRASPDEGLKPQGNAVPGLQAKTPRITSWDLWPAEASRREKYRFRGSPIFACPRFSLPRTLFGYSACGVGFGPVLFPLGFPFPSFPRTRPRRGARRGKSPKKATQPVPEQHDCPVAQWQSEVDPKSWTGRIVKSKPEQYDPCPRNDVSTVPSSKPRLVLMP